MRNPATNALLPLEKRTMAALGLLYAFRMLGLLMLLPVLALYAGEFTHSTPILIGLALGSYGLTQALLQIPFGMLSDRVGRKPVIIGGLVLFGLGSMLAANAASIWGVIAGRALQGSGAIASTILALLSDLTRREQRSKAMAFIGMSIGFTFILALLLGPWLSSAYGVRAIFWSTALLACFGLVIIIWLVPTVARASAFDEGTTAAASLIGRVLHDGELSRLNLGIFCLHLVLTSTFVALPLLLRDTLGLEPGQHAWVYISVLGAAFFAMLPLMVLGERRGLIKQVLLLAIALLALALLVLSQGGGQAGLLLGAMFVFFLAFNLLEATLPSLVSKLVFPAGKGTAMGVYSTCQFMGAFCGGVGGGVLMQHYGPAGVFAMSALVVLLWLLVARTMASPGNARDIVLRYDAARNQDETLLSELSGLRGVVDITLIRADCVAYIRVDEREFNEQCLRRFGAM